VDQPVGRLEGLLRRDRAIALAALAALTLLAWAITVRTARTMPGMGDMTSGMGRAIAMPGPAGWEPGDLLGLFTMWVVMMVAMMLPSVAPIVILVLGVLRRRHASRLPFGPTAAFLGGYVLVWAGFSLLATLAQWGLHSAALLSAGAMRATPAVGGLLLLAAGIFQWTPLKAACLGHCRSPFHFFSTEWREGVLGALVMGLRHGSWCLGCCWLLMSLLFVAGVMNLAWVAALAILVLLEKVAPAGPLLGRVFGVGLGVWGVWLLAGGRWG
jgi:predicted metal-binding membrane protein